jgi:hypothetical protein
MKKPDERRGNGDDESDLSDDPILSALNTDLEAALRITDNRLFIFVGGTLVASYLPEYLHVPPVAANVFYAGAVACIIGGIGFTILSVIKGKQKVAARYGLVCQACGHRPKTSQILLTAQIGRCAACGKELNLHKP